MMKKVMVILVAALVVATPVLAKSIRNSAHDLSDTSSARLHVVGQDFDRLCAWCHTPHNGRTDTEGPLWNRSVKALNTALLYNSSSLEDATKPNTIVSNGTLTQSDVPLCLTCHDGSVTGANDALINNPNNQWDPSTGSGDATDLGGTMTTDATIYGAEGLVNDHPVGMVYSDAYNDEVASGANGLFDQTTAEGGGVEFFGGGGVMWCSSCHDVHDPGTLTEGTLPFLITSNEGSAMCLACHNK